MSALQTRNLDLLVVLAIPSLAVVSALYLPDVFVPIRIVCGLLLVLVLPGYCLMVVLCSERASAGVYERLAVSLGFSITLLPLVGLVLFELGIVRWGYLTSYRRPLLHAEVRAGEAR